MCVPFTRVVTGDDEHVALLCTEQCQFVHTCAVEHQNYGLVSTYYYIQLLISRQTAQALTMLSSVNATMVAVLNSDLPIRKFTDTLITGTYEQPMADTDYLSDSSILLLSTFC